MLQIAIDGPAGAGKSTLARELAKELHIAYLDTGAMFRALGLKALQMGIAPSNGAGVETFLPQTKLDVRFQSDGQQRLYLDGCDVSELIRTPEVSAAASDISVHGPVRNMLLEQQRRIAAGQGVVMDGRDIGTRVLPDASVKFFLDAPVEVRAKRRCLELEQKGQKVVFEEVLADMKARDLQDSSRALAPLRCAEDAVVIHTGEDDVPTLVGRMLEIIRQKGA